MNLQRKCPECGQPIRFERLGRHLTPTKAAIFDLLQGGGRKGITLEDIRERLTACGRQPRNDVTLRSHLHQLADQIAHAGYSIGRSTGRKPSRWFLVDTTEEQAA